MRHVLIKVEWGIVDNKDHSLRRIAFATWWLELGYEEIIILAEF